MNRTLVIAISILLAFCAGIYFWTEWQKKEFDASLPEPPAPVQVRAAETNDDHTGGHWHGDEWHAEPHNSVFTTPIVDEDEVDFSVQLTTSAEPPLTFDEIDISDKDAEHIAFFSTHHPEYAEWKKKYLVHRAKEKRLREEWDALIPPGHSIDTEEEAEAEAEAFVKRFESLSNEEKRAFVKKLEELTQRGKALRARGQALRAEKPDLEDH